MSQAKSHVYYRLLLLILVFNLSLSPVFSQTHEKGDSLEVNALTAGIETRIENIVDATAKANAEKMQRNLALNNQNQVFNALESEVEHAKSVLKQGIDYVETTKELEVVIKLRQSAMEGMHSVNPRYLTLRNLATTTILLTEISNRTENQLKKIKTSSSAVEEIQKNIDSLAAKHELYIIPEDSLARALFYSRFSAMNEDVDEISLHLKNAVDSISRLEFLSNDLKYSLQADVAEIKRMQKDRQKNIKKGVDESFSDSNPDEKSLAMHVIYSGAKAALVLFFYLTNHYISLVVMVLFVIGISAYLNVLKKKFIKAGIYDDLVKNQVIFNHPVAVAFLVTITVYQFFLTLPPIILTAILWTIAGIALSFILKKMLSRFQYKVWLVFFMFGILAHADNLMLVHSVAESWFMVIVAISAAVFGIALVVKRKNFNNKPVLWIIAAAVVFEILSILLLVTGYYNIGKVFLTSGIYTVLTGYFLLHSYKFMKDILRFSEFLKNAEGERDTDRLLDEKNRISAGNYFFFILGWFILISRNSYFFQQSTEPINQWILEPREIGAFAFTIKGIIVFFLIILVSAVIARIVSFLSAAEGTLNMGTKKSGLGSWLLLIRISVITVGVLIAFVSAGIPVDRIVMIISALGVGIGFGMQALVNNLISGVIIAFEKPVNLNDIVEISGQTGKMKSIGIRSSVVTTYDGADLIIPNGDLLSQHLVNWTMGSNRRRYEIQVGVAYDTDLLKARSLINKVLSDNVMVLKNPEPVIWVTTFNNSSIDFVIKFWVAHFNYGFDVKSELMIDIDKIFRENGIVIPFPQQDIYIKTASDTKADDEKL